MLRKLIIGAALLYGVLTAEAAEMYPPMYDAHYNFTSDAGLCKVRRTSDGKGKLREETEKSGSKMVKITDYCSMTVYSISDAMKLVMKKPLTETYEGDFTSEVARQKNARNLGVKTIDGLICQGWSYKQDGLAADVWVEKDKYFLVKSDSRSPGLISSLELTSFSEAAPPESLFAIPSNYQIIPLNR